MKYTVTQSSVGDSVVEASSFDIGTDMVAYFYDHRGTILAAFCTWLSVTPAE